MLSDIERSYRMVHVDPRIHTTAALEREFDELSVEQKLKAIWFNGRETNGTVADALRRINDLELLVTPMVEEEDDTNAVGHFVKLWGGRGTAFLAFLIAVATFVVLVARG